MKYMTNSLQDFKRLRNDGVDVEFVGSFFEPKIEDLERIMEAMKGCDTVADVGSGSGKLLMIMSGYFQRFSYKPKMTGFDTSYCREKERPESKENVEFKYDGIENMATYVKKKYDCVICSWMPHYSDWREMLCSISNKVLILILSQDFNTGSVKTYTGCEEFGFNLYRKAWKSGNSIVQIWVRSNG